jgi:hypothetical protein
MRTLPDRFWTKVRKGDECWEWQGARSQGYGRFGLDGVAMGAHRLAWESTHGPVPSGMSVLHRCDNRRCVRPDHLFLGSQLDNMRDAVAKGRTAAGEGHGRHRLRASQVVAIRERYATGAERLRDLADEHGMSEAVMSLIVRGQKWPRVGGPIVERHRYSGRKLEYIGRDEEAA